MDKLMLYKYFLFALCIVFQFNFAYASEEKKKEESKTSASKDEVKNNEEIEVKKEEWSVITPTEGLIYKDDGVMTICWQINNGSTDINKNIIITLNTKNESNFKDGFIIGDNVNSNSKCINYQINNLGNKVDGGLKEIYIWDTNKNLLAKSKAFSITKKGNINFSKTSYVIIGAAIAVPVILVVLCNYKKKTDEIPNGSRSIPNLTVNRRKTYEPPIKSYRESWIELPQANISLESIEDVYDYDLLEEAEEAAKSMGLLDKIWKAKKAFVPTRDDELLVRVGDELIVREIYDDLWCYGQNKTLFEEKETFENKKIEYNNELSIQENEELAMFGMFPSVVLPIEFKNLKVTQATIQSIREASVVAEPIRDEVNNEDVVLKQDPNSVVIKIPSPPENMILPVKNLRRSSSLKSSLRRKVTNRTNISLSSTPGSIHSKTPITPISPMPPLPQQSQKIAQIVSKNDSSKQ